MTDMIDSRATGAFGCGLEAALHIVGSKWKPLVIFHLVPGARRYGELRRAIGGVSDKVLIQALKEMQTDGLVDRIDHGEIPPKVEYRLTDFGRSLSEAMKPLCQWGDSHRPQIEAMAARHAA